MGLSASPHNVLAGIAFAAVAWVTAGTMAGCVSGDDASEEVGATESPITGLMNKSFTPAADSYLAQATPTTARGTQTTLRVDGDDPNGSGNDLVTLMRWDVSAIPAGVTVREVTLTVNATNPGSSYEIYEAKRSWDEAKTTWNEASPGVAWATAGAAGAADRGTTVLGSMYPRAAGGYTLTFTSAGAAVVQKWVNDPKTNFGIVLANSTKTDGVAFSSREISTTSQRPKLTVGYDPPSTADSGSTADAGSGAGDVQPTFPIRAAFYYGWFPESWTQSGIYPFTNYTPSAGYYDTSVVAKQHVAEMQYGNIGAGIASWWGQGSKTDGRIPALLRAADNTTFRWSIYYENESTGDPTTVQLTSDLVYLRDHYGKDPSYLRINGKFVVFVYADGADACGMVDRWTTANANVGAYLVLKVFNGYRNCTHQPDAWHQYSPAVATDYQAGQSYAVSPGFWLKGQTERLARDLTRFKTNVTDMAASDARFHLVTTFNEWGEGTAVESATQWASASGHGAYLDALHAVANRGGLTTGGGGTADAGGGTTTDAGGGGSTDGGTATGTPTAANLKVAFIGDTAAGTNFANVLSLVNREAADAVVIQGDLTYDPVTPDQWFTAIDSKLTVPYFVAKGNHDTNWSTIASGLESRLTKWGITTENNKPSDGNYSIVYQGLKMVMVTDSETSPTRADYLQQRLSATDHLWKICSWHKDQRATNVGPKGDEMGWTVYENCRNNGALVAQGHSHTYSRSKTITADSTQSVDGTCSSPFDLCVSPGRHIFFDSSLGGVETRTLDTTVAGASYWGATYSGNYGALFIEFNVGGDPTKAHGYFKTVDNLVIDPPASSGRTTFTITRTR